MRSLVGPRVLFAFGMAALLILITATVVIILSGRSDCADRVQTRHDQRVMWLYALEQNPDPPNVRAIAFRIELDARIPELECRGWLSVHPEPIGEN